MSSSSMPISSTSTTTMKEEDFDYESLMPSAIVSFKAITKKSKNKAIALFLDYDGTLSPIVDDPELALMSNEMRSAVREVSKYFPTSIISGRGRVKVQEFVQIDELFYAGSHGMDIAGPEGSELYEPANAVEIRRTITQVCQLLKAGIMHIENAEVENNGLCCSVHYRRVKEESHEEVKTRANDIIAAYPSLVSKPGKMVVEIRPTIPWNKGSAVEYLIQSLGIENVFPIYIGDDRTDEDAFEVLPNYGGCGILVSEVPKPTKASYSLRDPSEVMEFILGLGLEGLKKMHGTGRS